MEVDSCPQKDFNFNYKLQNLYSNSIDEEESNNYIADAEYSDEDEDYYQTITP